MAEGFREGAGSSRSQLDSVSTGLCCFSLCPLDLAVGREGVRRQMRGGLPRMSTKHGALCILSCNKPGGRRPGAQPWGGEGTQGQFC